MNQSCDPVHRFDSVDGNARVAPAVTGTTAPWTAIAAPAPTTRTHLTNPVITQPESDARNAHGGLRALARTAHDSALARTAA
jgi:hypothetical protein